eukprot:CAMPEP_0172687730 /NCGR_PEP_ID=MMETSP1074-20121228/21906_1 /TAXON_ID=2916 /ORGANISM="Ceratium fusus, Strain PA161109" /LENGTH=172 /DNA_ID=CAMNT_0013507243 /DNA_START=103 /DNA_END=624 /DNA_ORIENTATION=-
MCAENPFGALFGDKSDGDRNRRRTPKPARKPPSRRNESEFEPRSHAEAKYLVQRWVQFAHPRTNEFFTSPQMLEDVLMQVLQGVNKNQDPVLGDNKECVYWYGDVTSDEPQAMLKMTKPGESDESVTYVNRVLAFIFASDESFEALMRLPKQAFRMTCGDQLCITLGHVSLA